MGHLLKIKCVGSRVNVHSLASTSVPFTLTTVQVPNLELTHTKRITVQEELDSLCLLFRTSTYRHLINYQDTDMVNTFQLSSRISSRSQVQKGCTFQLLYLINLLFNFTLQGTAQCISQNPSHTVQGKEWLSPQGADPPLSLSAVKAGRNHLNKYQTLLLPTGIGEHVAKPYQSSQTSLQRRCELPL